MTHDTRPCQGVKAHCASSSRSGVPTWATNGNRGAGFWVVIAFVAHLLAIGGCSGATQAESGPPGTPLTLPEPGTYAIDPPHTFVYFAAQHQVVGKVRGRFDKMTGTITVSKDVATCAVDVAIEAGSVDTQNTIRDEDLRSPAFFDAAKFPVIRFHGRGIRKSGDAWVLDGSLSIHGIEKTVPLKFTFKGVASPQQGEPGRIAFHAAAAVKRADFGMTRELLAEIGSASDTPDVWIEIDTELLATDQPR